MADRHAVVEGYLGGGWVKVDSVLADLELVEQVRGLNQLTIHLRWEEKDLAGIARAAEMAERLIEGVKEEEVLGAFKAICFNRAAFFWRGWGDDDVEVSREAESAASRFAGMNLELAVRLNKPEVAKGRAEWLVGAFDWAAGLVDEAGLRFDRAKDLVEDEREVLMMRAYGRAVREEDVSEILERLDGMEEGGFYSDQVRTAMGVYGTS